MARAPSEKHLENWLINNLSLFNQEMGEGYEFVSSQLKLPSGVPDLITYNPGQGLTIFELKAEAIDHKAITQIMRYMRDMKEIAEVTLGLIRDPTDVMLGVCDPKITGVLIGDRVKDESLLISAKLSDIDFYTYSYISLENNYIFEPHMVTDMDVMEAYQYSLGPVGECIRKAFRESIESATQNPQSFFMLRNMVRAAKIFMLETYHGIKTEW